MKKQKPEARSQKSEVNKKLIFLFCVLYSVFYILSSVCFAEETSIIITSDFLEYDKKTSLYTAKGSVKVQQDETTIEAIEMQYNEKTSDVFAEGNVRYEDSDITLKAEKAEYNLDTKRGRFYNAEIFSKGDNFYVSGTEIEKRGENEYYLTKAQLTTCDASPPAWCFRGRDVDVTVGDRLKAKDATFNIKGIPVLYTPYLWAPVLTERKTGFLTPVIGYSRTKGFSYSQPFFWAIAENKDATFVADWYSKRGIGKGIEYRYMDFANVEGTHWLYHIKDKKLDKNFYELRSLHSRKNPEGISTYLNLNLLSGKNFYREYSRRGPERIKRFLESTSEVSLPTENSRVYLMAQYLTDLKDDIHTSTILQRIPEFGYVINPYRVGPAFFSLTSSATNFTRERGIYGQRMDIYPKLSHSFGDRLIIFQNLGLRKTVYYLHRNEEEGYPSSVHRDLFDYNITASSRIIKGYSSFSHAIEPSLAYTFIPMIRKDKTNLPLFDSTELYSRQSTIQFSVLNRIFDNGGEFFTLNLSESYNSYGGDRPFSPLTIAASIGKPLQLSGDISYNPYSGRIENINSAISLTLYTIGLKLNERYDMVNNNMFYDLGINYSYSNLSTTASLWYDAKGGGVRDATLSIRYQKQCWGVTMIVNRKPPDEVNNRPSDYNIFITIELFGLGSMKV